MAWYEEAVFYHIYPLGLLDCPRENPYGEPVHRLPNLTLWIDHIKKLGCTAIYIGPLFESVGHGYETTDYRKLDSRLGDNRDLTDFVAYCHAHNIKVIFDGVFNHVGRDFFAFRDLQQNRESSPYKDWFCNVNFWGNNEYNDGFSYENWGGYNLLVKLNQRNPAVKEYLYDAVRFWIDTFDVDGIRLDAADVLDFDFMHDLRCVTDAKKKDFWLMGEVIHGDYSRWANGNMLHSVTNYALHKALYSGHNDHNYFEIAHTVKRLYDMGGNRPDGLKLYNFVDNHDVERIYTKLNNKTHFYPVHVLLYTLPGVPSIYYGSEFAIEGRKEKSSDASLRPALRLADFADAMSQNPYAAWIAKLGAARQATPALSYGNYQELLLRNRQYAFARVLDHTEAIITVNNDDNGYDFYVGCRQFTLQYIGLMSGKVVSVENGQLHVYIDSNTGDIWVPYTGENTIPVVDTTPSVSMSEPTENVSTPVEEPVAEDSICPTDSTEAAEETVPDRAVDAVTPTNEPASDAEQIASEAYERGRIAGLQEAILALMEQNGYVNDQMRKDVTDNVYHDSLINWVKSFRR